MVVTTLIHMVTLPYTLPWKYEHDSKMNKAYYRSEASTADAMYIYLSQALSIYRQIYFDIRSHLRFGERMHWCNLLFKRSILRSRKLFLLSLDVSMMNRIEQFQNLRRRMFFSYETE